MKVGILSMQEIYNYGSFLQAYAIKSTIEQLGGECNFINVKVGEQLPGLKFNRNRINFIKNHG